MFFRNFLVFKSYRPLKKGDAGTLVLVTSTDELGSYLLDINKRQFSPFTIMMEIGQLNDQTSKMLRDNADQVANVITYRNKLLVLRNFQFLRNSPFYVICSVG